MHASQRPLPGARFRQSGFSLIELMISLVLGLLVVLAASAMFLANRQVYASSETVNRLQENGRAAFELMSRDTREAGGNPCMSGLSRVVNHLQSAGSAWWANFENGLTGVEGGADPDSLTLFMANEGLVEIVDHDEPDADLTVTDTTGIQNGDILLACNAEAGVIFKVTGVSGTTGLAHAVNASDPAGNCSAEFQFPPSRNIDETTLNCTPGPARDDAGYCFVGRSSGDCQVEANEVPAFVVRMTGLRWSVADNGRGGNSLFRTVIRPTGGVPNAANETATEVAEGVRDMQITYRAMGGGGYVDASAVADWSQVEAVRIELTLEASEGALRGQDIRGTDGELLSRVVTNTVAIRTRVLQ